MAEKKVEFLYLSEADMIKAGVLDAKECVETIDAMFKVLGEGDYLMGGFSENDHGIRLCFPAEKRFPNMPIAGPDRRFMAMIAYLGGEFNVCSNKWYGSNILNPTRGLPRSVLMVTLNNVDTGEPIAYMSGNLLSAMRTGAVPAVGAKYLASKNSEVATLIGAGVINRATLLCLPHAIKNLKKVKVFDVVQEKGQQFAAAMTKETGLSVESVDSIEEAVRDSDFVNFATSGSSQPEVNEKWLKENVVLSSHSWIGISDEMLMDCHIVLDERKMHEAWKCEDDQIPEEEAYKKYGFPSINVFRLLEEGRIKQTDVKSLSTIVSGKVPGRTSEREKFFLIIGGLPVEDAAWGYRVYQNALKKSIGQKLTLWEEAHWK